MFSRRRVFLVPTVNVADDVHGLAADLYQFSSDQPHEAVLDFSRSRFLSPAAILLLAGYRDLMSLRGATVALSIQGSSLTLQRYLRKIGFLDDRDRPIQSFTIPIHHFRSFDKQSIAYYLEQLWSTKLPALVADRVKRDYVVSSVAELFINVFHHARSPLGLLTCGQYFPGPKRLQLTLLDLGIGIPNSVRSRFERHSGWFSPGPALEWAFQSGHSRLGETRGLGLAILKEFLQENDGVMQVHANAARGFIGRRSRFWTRDRAFHFEGTLVDVTIGNVTTVPAPPEVIF